MRSSADPSVHRQREQRSSSTSSGCWTTTGCASTPPSAGARWRCSAATCSKEDGEVELKRLMSEMGVPDRELQAACRSGRGWRSRCRARRS